MFAKRILGMGLLSALVGPFLTGCTPSQMQVLKFEMRDLKVRMSHMEKEVGRQDQRMSAMQTQLEQTAEVPPAATPVVDTAPAPKTRRMVRLNTRQIQVGLKSAGHSPGTIDGKMGPRTRSAIKAFQRAEGLRTTGQADSETMTAINSFL
jgi:peptidoglycan hydrolase-like protein with peptidoglycan-binding domain